LAVPLAQARSRAGRLKTAFCISKLEAAAPTGAEDLVLDLYKQIPPTRITDLLLEVDAATGFTSVHPSAHRSTCADRIGLMNVILAEGINLGLRKMADATNTHTFWELIRIDGGMSRRSL
jgi:hypothetical protein